MSLDKKCLSLTGTFETSKMAPDCFSVVSGNFDGQGISFGALQWNLGQETLQPILKQILTNDPGTMQEVFGDYLPTLLTAIDGDRQDAMNFSGKITDRRGVISPVWKKMFVDLGSKDSCQKEQVRAAKSYFSRAKNLAKRFDINKERGVALMFDCCVQNGGVRNPGSKELAIALEPFSEDPVGRMMVLANWVSGMANPKWKMDVFARKMCIASGSGKVHGREFNIETDFGITLSSV